MQTADRLAKLEEAGHGHCLEAIMLRGPEENELREYLQRHEGLDTKHTRRAERALTAILHPTPKKNKRSTS